MRFLTALFASAALFFAGEAHAQTLAPGVQIASAQAHIDPMGAAIVPAAPTPRAQPSSPNEPPPAPLVGERMFRGHSEDELLREMSTRPVTRVIERFNSSTLVFHCVLEGGMEVAFKPARQGERDWWVHEISGYELARVLGIEGRVPPAVYKRVPRAALDGFLRDANLEVERDGTVEGAAIFWMPVLHRSNIQTPESRAQWNTWLDPETDVPAESRARATQIAGLIVFDYLQANFDRWNTANVPMDENNDLVFRDNNRGWYLQNLVRTDRGGIDGIRRIPASMLGAVERATGEVLARRAVGVPFPVLNDRQVREYETRRRALLARVAEVSQRYGRERVLMDDSAAPIARPMPEAPSASAPPPASPVAVSDERPRERHGRRGRHGRHGRHRHRRHHRSHSH